VATTTTCYEQEYKPAATAASEKAMMSDKKINKALANPFRQLLSSRLPPAVQVGVLKAVATTHHNAAQLPLPARLHNIR
jgi:hypothetical protein